MVILARFIKNWRLSGNDRRVPSMALEILKSRYHALILGTLLLISWSATSYWNPGYTSLHNLEHLEEISSTYTHKIAWRCFDYDFWWIFMQGTLKQLAERTSPTRRGKNVILCSNRSVMPSQYICVQYFVTNECTTKRSYCTHIDWLHTSTYYTNAYTLRLMRGIDYDLQNSSLASGSKIP